MYRLIYFFGPDGTGKTTHANLTAYYLSRMGYRVWRASVKHHHTIAYLLLKLMRIKDPKIYYYGFNPALKLRLRRVWKIVEFLGLISVIFYRVLIPLYLGYIVICDRYVLDTLVTLSYFLDDRSLLTGVYARILTSFIPKNSILIHLDADTKTILLRKREEPLNTRLVKYYQRAYRFLVKFLDLKVMDIDTTSTPIKDVQREIIKIV